MCIWCVVCYTNKTTLLKYAIIIDKKGAKVNKKDILDFLKDNKKFLQNRYNIKTLELFGSIARGDYNKNSDIDILVEFSKMPDLLTFIEIEEFLANQLNRTVDLVVKRKLKPQLKDRILKEAIAI
jgi:predicted nucleotidyltransferase